MRKFTRSWVQKNHTVEENSPWIPQISAYLIHIEPVLFCLLSCLYSKLPYKIQPFYLQNGGQLFIVQNNKDNGPSGEKPGQDCLQLVIKDVGFLKPRVSQLWREPLRAQCTPRWLHHSTRDAGYGGERNWREHELQAGLYAVREIKSFLTHKFHVCCQHP